MSYIETAYSQGDQLSWMWDCELSLPFYAEHINFRVESLEIPSFQFEIERKLSQETYLKSIKQPDEVSISFRESDKFEVYNILQKWMGSFYNDKTKTVRAFSSANAYNQVKGDIILTYYKPPLFSFLKPSRVMKFKLADCLPVGITPLSPSYSEGDALRITFSVIPEVVEFERLTI